MSFSASSPSLKKKINSCITCMMNMYFIESMSKRKRRSKQRKKKEEEDAVSKALLL